MHRALILTGVLALGTVLVFGAAALTAMLVPNGTTIAAGVTLTWSRSGPPVGGPVAVPGAWEGDDRADAQIDPLTIDDLTDLVDPGAPGEIGVPEQVWKLPGGGQVRVMGTTSGGTDGTVTP